MVLYTGEGLSRLLGFARLPGAQITCADWLIEAAYRMIQNNLDPEVAENPDALVVYGGIGKAARSRWLPPSPARCR